ncbi:MAG: hypothetical protein Q4A27_01505 [bacterium]|nr:hypothetical protein [bacterium]
MKKILKNLTIAAFSVALSIAGVSAVVPAVASNQVMAASLKDGIDAAKTEDQQESLFGDSGIFTTIVNVMLFLIGVLSVVMLIYGGIQYVISTGDSGKVNNAKNTILYAIVGLIVAILSYAIINFVLTSFNIGG